MGVVLVKSIDPDTVRVHEWLHENFPAALELSHVKGQTFN